MTQHGQGGPEPSATGGSEHGGVRWNRAEPDDAPAPNGAGRRATERHGVQPTHSRRGLLRAGIGGAAALGVAGIGYAAFRLGSGNGPAGTDTDAGPAASSGGAGPTGARSSTAPAANTTTQAGFDGSSLSGPYVYQRRSDPARTIVGTMGGKQVAVLTDGARTVAFTGPTRTFTEPATTTATVTTDVWVRLAPQRWSEGAQHDDWFESWFGEQVASASPDLFGLYAQYAAGAPDRYEQSVRYAGAAKFGELTASEEGYENPLGDRDDRADFYDYLGVSYDFPDGVGKPHSEWYGDLDCSGLVRILYGYRMGYPMYLGDGPSGGSDILPRHSYSIAAGGPGPMLFGGGASSAPSAAELETLQPGDLMFFAEGGDPSTVDHCGIYFGADQYGRRRFISSRMGANGPTFGDAAGMSVINGTGIYSRAFRGARRI
jgi:NlpC/P60 family